MRIGQVLKGHAFAAKSPVLVVKGMRGIGRFLVVAVKIRLPFPGSRSRPPAPRSGLVRIRLKLPTAVGIHDHNLIDKSGRYF